MIENLPQPDTYDPWKLVWTYPDYSAEKWGIRRHNKTSGKCGYHIVALCTSEYVAKTIANDANRASNCFAYEVVSPKGEVFKLVKQSTELPPEGSVPMGGLAA